MFQKCENEVVLISTEEQTFLYKIIPEDLKLIQAQILIDFQLEDNKHKEEEGKRAGEKEMNCEPFHRECFYVTGTHFFFLGTLVCYFLLPGL